MVNAQEDMRPTEFHFSVEGMTVSLAGSESFVERQFARLKPWLHVATGGTPATERASTVDRRHTEHADTHRDFATYAAAQSIREGRGAIQDRLLLVFWHLHHVCGRTEIGVQDIKRCMLEAGWEVPGTLHNHLGILKRKHEHLQEGSRRGLYSLSEAGKRVAQARFL